MANYLNFDVYDLELTDIHTNSDLRKLLINTANRSILVVEDIDCSLEIDDRKAEERALKMLRSSQSQIQTVNIVRKDKANQVTLSGLLNFIDGYGLVVETKGLSSSRLTTRTDWTLRCFALDEWILLEETTVTPAEVGEQLLRNENVEVALGGLIQFLLEKKKESDEQKAKEVLLKEDEGEENEEERSQLTNN
ncbi:UNVERIFIED_CONTAM: protein HYPER-SENSITIVITY-RELATED 4 [Sesamum angustifolium]|uniref:Protein HYPER-SENSITIVITY-RELATED 4 n=1 Tax=Sesamum angustifolium TaxID=2727405 RepID=A0AAW2QCL5_9LAMI